MLSVLGAVWKFLVDNFFVLLPSLILLYVSASIKQTPKYISDRVLENIKARNSKDIQVESYFRQLGGEEQQKVFEDWTRQLTHLGESQITDEEMLELIHNTLIFGSDQTVKILASMAHYIYTSSDSDQGNMMTVYTACIISSLKEDFSGYAVSPLIIVRMKISDFDDLKQSYVKCFEIIKRDISSENNEFSSLIR